VAVVINFSCLSINSVSSQAFYCVSFLLVIVYACESALAFQGWREKAEQEAFEIQVSRVAAHIHTHTHTHTHTLIYCPCHCYESMRSMSLILPNMTVAECLLTQLLAESETSRVAPHSSIYNHV